MKLDMENKIMNTINHNYNGLYGEAPPEMGTFFRLQVYKRVGI